MDFTENLNRLKEVLWDHKWRRRATLAAGSAVAILGGAWLLVELVLIPRAADRLEHELAKLGIHISYEDPDLSLWQGSLTLSEIVLHRTAEKDERLLSISNFGVRIDLAELVWQQALWGQGSTRDASLVVYGEERHLQFDQLDADIEIDPNRLSVVRCACTTNIGYHLELTGELLWGEGSSTQEAGTPAPPPTTPAADPASPSPSAGSDAPLPDFPGDLVWLQDVADFFICEPQGGELATLKVELKWDETATPPVGESGSAITNHQLSLVGHISGRDLVWQNLPLQALVAPFSIDNWLVDVAELNLVGLGGEATLSGRYDLDSHQMAVGELKSTMDPIKVIGRIEPSFAKPLLGIEYTQPPSITGEGLMVDFDNLQASEIKLTLEATGGIRYRESPEDDEFLELMPLTATIVYEDSPDILIKDLKTQIQGLDVKGMVTLQKSQSPLPIGPESNGASPAQSPDRAEAAPSQVGAEEDLSSAEEFSLVRTLNNLWFVEYDHGEAPLLKVDITTGRPESDGEIQIEGEFSGADFTWHGRAIRSAQMSFGFSGSQFEVERIQLAGLGGELDASGSYDLDKEFLVIPRLSSTVDIAVLQEKLEIDLPEPFDTIDFPSAPEITIAGLELQLGESISGRGRASMAAEQGFVVSDGNESLAATRFNVAMVWDEPQALTIEGAAGRIEDLEFELDGSLHWRAPVLVPQAVPAQGAPGADHPLKAKPSSAPVAQTLPPSQTPPILARLKKYLPVDAKGNPVRLVGKFDWDETRSAAGAPDAEAWKKQLQLQADITGRNFSWLDFSVRNADGRINLEDGVLHFVPFQLETTEGAIESQATYEIGARRLRMQTLRLTVDPVTTLERFGLRTRDVDWIDFLGSPIITGKDLLLDFNDMTNSSGELRKLDTAGIALTPPGARTAVFEDVRGLLIIDRGVFTAKNASAEFLGGDARLNFEWSPYSRSPSYSTSVAINNISLAELNDWLDPTNRVIEKGTFNLEFNGTGTDSIESLVGRGRATVGAESGSAQDFPLINGLVGFLEGLFPVLSRSRYWELDLPFDVGGGKITSDAGRLTGRRVSANLSGSLDWVNDRVEILAGVNLSGLVGIITSIATPLREDFIEVVGRGTFENLEWDRRRSVERRDNREKREADATPNRRRGILRRNR